MECTEICSLTHDKICCLKCEYRKNRKCTHPEMHTGDINCNPIRYIEEKRYAELNNVFEKEGLLCRYSDIEFLLTKKERTKFMAVMI